MATPSASTPALGRGATRPTTHDNIVRKRKRKLESILKFAGQNDIVAEDADVFKWCIYNEARRERHVKAMGARGTRRDAHGIRPDLSALRSAVAVSDAYPLGNMLSKYARGTCEISKRL